jgi:sigma-E factor negative regulatory protein RseB
MKRYWVKFAVILSGALFSVVAFAAPVTVDQLKQMRQAALTLNYELAFINVTRNNVESLRYRHAIVNKQPLAQLIQMDGTSREILMKGSEISYFFEQGVEPFTISGDHIIDAMPPIVFVDFNRIEKFYDFIPVGRARVANRICNVIRVVARDGYRYSYVVWIDNETKLPMQIELLDRNSETLEQFRVVSFAVDNQVKNSLAGLANLQLPPLLPQLPNEPLMFNWKIDWLPEGFAEVTRNRHRIANVAAPIETRLFSDGLFSISVNVMPIEQENPSKYLHEGRKTIYTEVRQGHEIVVVGDIPQNTAKQIADAITFSAQ